MAGGEAYCESTVKVEDTPIDDVTEWTVLFGGEPLSNRADGRKYPQIACTVNHTAEIGVKTLDLGAFSQSAAATPTLGSVVSSVVLAAESISGNTTTVTLAKARYIRAGAQGGHARLADCDLAWEAIGEGGVEPTVTVATAA